ncbi:MAG: hypothetical protein JKY37_21980, partial [Nannocystaceae bacterium]|nr:hypothetical protein [Nannocystaceae bacterium]
MRVHTVVVGSVLGMIASSALAWTVGAGGIPPSAKAATESTDVSAKTWTGAAETAVTAPRVAKTQFEVDGPLRMSGRVGNAVVAAQQEGETFVFVNLSAASERFGQA